MLLQGTRWTVFMEDALRDSWENKDHWIHSIVLMCVTQFQYPCTICHKLSVKEFVHRVHLNDYVHQAQELTTPVANGIEFVTLEGKIFFLY